jgi:hypothetical protein
MVRIEINGDRVTFEVAPWQALLAFRRCVRVRLDQITGVSAPSRQQVLRPFLRMPGATIPWLLAAGTYVGPSQREFWCVTRRPQVLVVELTGHEFTRLVIETTDPAADMKRLGGAVASTPRVSWPKARANGGTGNMRLDTGG